MELDFVSEVDERFYSSNFLLSDDWGSGSCVEGLSSLLPDGPLTADDLMAALPDDLGIPMLDGEEILMDQADMLHAMGDGSLQDASDSSDSGLDCGSVIIKDELLSPRFDTPLQGTTIQLMDLGQAPSFADILPADIKLESPPLTPEREVTDLPKPAPMPISTNSLNFDLTTINTQPTVQKLPAGYKIITGANGVHIIQAPIPATNPVTTVLNSKVKIQPRPPAPLQPSTAIANTGAVGEGKPLVLTAEQFAKLTQQGVLKFQHPAEHTTSLPLSQPSTPILTAAQHTTRHSNGDGKLVKRQQRMIKNRESACLSRKRKKEYVSSVEKQLHEFCDENARLKEQNDQLRKRIKLLQTENQQLKSTFGRSVKKAGAVAVVLFLLSLNLGPLKVLLNGPHTTQQLVEQQPASHIYHHGRTLLAFNETETSEHAKPHQTNSKYQHAPGLHTIRAAFESVRKMQSARSLPRDMMVKHLEEINIPVSMCPSYFNSSESERLMNELTGWVLGHKAGMKAAANAAGNGNTEPVRPHPQHTKRQRRKKYAAPRKLKAAFKASDIPKIDRSGGQGQYEVQVFTDRDRAYQDFMHAIHRRNDTFYVVSFRRDHLLLPATAHNQTTRPRMSLLMPVVSTNETLDLPEGNIAMMQIDCEVTATRLLHVHKSTVPKDVPYGPHTNHTAPPSVHTSRHQAPRKWPQKSKWRPRS